MLMFNRSKIYSVEQSQLSDRWTSSSCICYFLHQRMAEMTDFLRKIALWNMHPLFKERVTFQAFTLSLLAKLADKLKKSAEDEIHFLKARVLELESDLVSKSIEVTSAVSTKEEALSSAFAEIDRLKEENSVKM
ncbi:uncharacterized protein LOC131236035 isoform X2 [Magnolia sinica]|uniref:uncharacterized protein LOC131236035 isoform X2 n=1 Tax=Magnolia sinica TaxID=86752 RepID=UPI002658D19F|nr:uncharacterized protein LOC131236035 isoform X2 [Magnolia sinica]